MGDWVENIESVITLKVPSGYRDLARLDVYLTAFIQNATRAKVQRSIREGQVSVNRREVIKVSHKVQAGDFIECRVMRPPPLEIVPEDLPLDIIFEDEDLVVVNKAAGMVVHPAYGHRSGTLVNAMLYHVGASVLSVEADKGDFEFADLGLSNVNLAPPHKGMPVIRPGIVHRLDKDTSGLLVVAKNDVAHAKLARQFEKHTIRRRYQAIVWGLPDPPEGTVQTYLGRDPRNRKHMAVVAEKQGKWAVTHYRTLSNFTHTSLLEFRLETGRTHQIRVHAKHLHHPIVGDPSYDGQRISYGPDTDRRRAFFKNLFKVLPRQALHARELGFVHPRTEETLHFEAEIPADMTYVVDRLREIEGVPEN